MDFNLEKRIWWDYAEEDLRELLEASIFLLNTVRSWGGDLSGGKEEFHDYSFCVFPAAKAYEGYLKKVFLDMGFINEKAYFGKHFRIGKALNPALEKKYRGKDNVYDQIVKYCGGKDLADTLWEAWRKGRNLITHWFPNEKNAITFSQAQDRVNMILSAMDMVFKECKVSEA
ncbi:hypothetical protein ISR94_02125 [Candidatus Microgenomates bacterium]|nr:hypothetical protein [Candidatus Microgenomates bacterium]